MKCSRWRRVYNSDVIVAVSLVLNFKPFIIFVSGKKIQLKKKIEESNLQNNVDVSNSWFLSTMKIQAYKLSNRHRVLVCLRSLIVFAECTCTCTCIFNLKLYLSDTNTDFLWNGCLQQLPAATLQEANTTTKKSRRHEGEHFRHGRLPGLTVSRGRRALRRTLGSCHEFTQETRDTDPDVIVRAFQSPQAYGQKILQLWRVREVRMFD